MLTDTDAGVAELRGDPLPLSVVAWYSADRLTSKPRAAKVHRDRACLTLRPARFVAGQMQLADAVHGPQRCRRCWKQA